MTLSPVQQTEIENLSELQPEGWPDIRNEFTFYVNNSFCSPFKLMVNNSIVGLGTLIVFGESAWLAHIIVSPQHRKKGYGQLIVNELIKLAAEQGIGQISLVATSLGKPVYEKEGFENQGIYKGFVKNPKNSIEIKPSQHIRSFEPKWQERVLALDEQICGEPRGVLISQYFKTAKVYIENKDVLGYYLPALREGPIYAIDKKAGLALLQLKLSTCSKIAIPAVNTAAIETTLRMGFEAQNVEMIRMSYNTPIDFRPQHVYARIGGNFG